MEKVVVVGAGVLGASCAHTLAAAGADVTLVEMGQPGSGTSSRGAGLVSEGLWHPANIALVQRSLALFEAWSQGDEEGGPFVFHRTGSTTLVPEGLVADARRMATLQRAAGVPVQTLPPDELAKLPRHEGMRLDDVAEGYHYPRDGWALPRFYTESVAAEAVEKGARLVRSPAVLLREEGRVRVRLKDGALRADAIVLATGIWTRSLLQGAGLDAPILAYRTQAARFNHPRTSRVPILHDAVQGFYLRPHWPGQLIAGNGTTTRPEDVARWRQEADPTFIEATARRLAHRFPDLTPTVAADGWAGLDAATPDRLLLAGAHPEAPDVWLLAGGNGYGFMRAPAAGEALAHRLLGKAPPVDLAPFDPARFRGALSAPFDIREGYSLSG